MNEAQPRVLRKLSIDHTYKFDLCWVTCRFITLFFILQRPVTEWTDLSEVTVSALGALSLTCCVCG